MSDAGVDPASHVHPLIAARWSPTAFDPARPVADADVRALFEAARLAPSSRNEQPWRYLVATDAQPELHAQMVSCLTPSNQVWAVHAPVLVLTVAAMRFASNDQPNHYAWHDIGLASATLALEATSRGLFVHQMAGIDPPRARELFAIPDGFDPVTCLAIGYRGDPATLPETLRPRDLTRRPRRPQREFVFAGAWGESRADAPDR